MKLRSAIGQVAIFVILIFQVLFILFAMAINIALVTHDKINLQNSVDMATLYGAQRQAEVLDVISHINFQMRQNYKLLAWRYRILGTVGHNNVAPGAFYCPPKKGSNANTCADSRAQGGGIMQATYPEIGFFDKYFICTSVNKWGETGPGTDHCQNNGVSVTRIELPKVSWLVPLTEIFSSAAHDLVRSFNTACSRASSTNAMLAHLFLTHFRLDQKDRRLMLQEIFKETLAKGKDLDGKLIRKGALKTLKKNLTYANLKNFNESDFNVFNSFQGLSFRDFLEPIPVFPVLYFLETNSTCSGNLKTTMDSSFNNPVSRIYGSSPEAQGLFKQFMQFNQNLSTDFDKPLNSLLLGFAPKQTNKKTLYFGISTQISYSTLAQLFFPFIGSTDTLSLKASAFSKPFGGKIGPTKEADPLISKLIEAGSGGAASILPYLYQPNYSLFPGDKLGLLRRELHANQYLKKGSQADSTVPRASYYNLKHYRYLFPTEGDTPARNPLPFDALANNINSVSPKGNLLLPARLMELTAIAPDLFDLTYYSILNNYMETYFPRICKLIGQSSENCNPEKRDNIEGATAHFGAIRGDFGYPYTNTYRESNRSALKTTVSLSPFFFHYRTDTKMRINPQQAVYYHENRPLYLLRDPAHTLTSWGPTTRKDRYKHYGFPEKIFMKCQQPASKQQIKYLIPSSCAAGGRSGYSVKLISCEQVKRFSNRPPSLDSYCESGGGSL